MRVDHSSARQMGAGRHGPHTLTAWCRRDGRPSGWSETFALRRATRHTSALWFRAFDDLLQVLARRRTIPHRWLAPPNASRRSTAASSLVMRFMCTVSQDAFAYADDSSFLSRLCFSSNSSLDMASPRGSGARWMSGAGLLRAIAHAIKPTIPGGRRLRIEGKASRWSIPIGGAPRLAFDVA